MRVARFAFPLALMLIALGLPAIGKFAYGYEPSVIGFPLALGLFAAAMGMFALHGEWRGEGRPAEALADESEGLLDNRQTWLQFAWLCFFVLMALTLGFLIGPALAITLYFLADKRPWHWAVFAGLATPAAIWLLFILILQTPLPIRPIFLD